MTKRNCGECGKDRPVEGGRVCGKDRFICKACVGETVHFLSDGNERNT